eukprot:TRINITY_DN11284_c0_g1_i1.p1 TRINITY_DN11284_c0_g1~~TRINITY_DN11284_c0_g1_i1.p1  ORF type:complete len:706 (+),score=204.16 TRINITY_DN11284_c0_g1_i1:59-2176(+)
MAAILSLALAAAGLRPPAVPIAVQDPMTHFWSPHDHLNDGWVQRWNGREVQWQGLVRVGAACWTWMGVEHEGCPNAQQKAVRVAATATYYSFSLGGDIEFNVTFRTAKAVEEGDVDYVMTSLPVTYVNYTARNLLGQNHAVAVYFDSDAAPAVGALLPLEQVKARRAAAPADSTVPYEYVAIGTAAQKFNSPGDLSLRNDYDWGWFTLGYPAGARSGYGLSAVDARAAFATDAPAYPADNNGTVFGISRPCIYTVIELKEGADGVARALGFIGYDEGAAVIEYFGTALPPYWLHAHGSFGAALNYAAAHAGGIAARCDAFDARVAGEMGEVGGVKYAELGGLGWRQVYGGLAAAWNPVTKEIWMFLKEISSAGDVSTVDVIYPAAPALLYYSPELLRKLLLPLMSYANNSNAVYGTPHPYTREYAPHHLGHWPVCDLPEILQENMPVEESANMILFIAYLARAQNSTAWMDEAKYWPLLDTWAAYLAAHLPDPGKQLCTDDFEGPSPHNTNLALKGVIALDAHAQLLSLRGKAAAAANYTHIARACAANWTAQATAGDHTKLQFDSDASTWSLKYNFLWQELLRTTTFEQGVLDAEVSFYRTKIMRYGLPMDNRHGYGKHDWSMWAAGFGDRPFFDAVVDTVYEFLGATQNRYAWPDWTRIDRPDVVPGYLGLAVFRGRPVVGGVWARLLAVKKPLPPMPPVPLK